MGRARPLDVIPTSTTQVITMAKTAVNTWIPSTTAQMDPSVYIRSSINKMNPMLKRLLPSTLLIASWGALILNAANEVAVEKFLENKIKFIDIPVIIEHALNNMKLTKKNTLKSILACDKLTRDQISDYIKIRWK